MYPLEESTKVLVNDFALPHLDTRGAYGMDSREDVLRRTIDDCACKVVIVRSSPQMTFDDKQWPRCFVSAFWARGGGCLT